MKSSWTAIPPLSYQEALNNKANISTTVSDLDSTNLSTENSNYEISQNSSLPTLPSFTKKHQPKTNKNQDNEWTTFTSRNDSSWIRNSVIRRGTGSLKGGLGELTAGFESSHSWEITFFPLSQKHCMNFCQKYQRRFHNSTLFNLLTSLRPNVLAVLQCCIHSPIY